MGGSVKQYDKTYAIIGVGGYVAKKHLDAIKATGGTVVAACDVNDSVGILDSYNLDCQFFINIGDFMSFLKDNDVDYLVVCTPNYTHSAHCFIGRQCGCRVICEKPMGLSVSTVEDLVKYSVDDLPVSPILQMRLNTDLIEIKRFIEVFGGRMHVIDIDYRTARGPWYHHSWKGDSRLSGGLLMNIGIHLFDACIWMLGDVKSFIVYDRTLSASSGKIRTENGVVNWSLDIAPLKYNVKVRRNLTINGSEFNLDSQFGDGHIRSYEEILAGNSFSVSSVIPAIDLVNRMTSAKLNKVYEVDIKRRP